MANQEVSQQNENPTAEPKLSTSVSEDGDWQKASSQPDEPTQEAIARRAYELWIENGRLIGSQEVDWSRAEQELRTQGQKAQVASASGS